MPVRDDPGGLNLERRPPGQRVPTALVPTGVVALVREHSRPRAMPGVRLPSPARPGAARRRTRAHRTGQALGAATMLLALGGCSWVSGMFGTDDGPPTDQVSVLDITVGQCFAAQQEAHTELSS